MDNAVIIIIITAVPLSNQVFWASKYFAAGKRAGVFTYPEDLQ